MKKLFQILIQTGVLLSLAACSQAPATLVPTAISTPCVGSAITLGDIDPENPARVIEGGQPFANYLAGQLTSYGIACGKVKVARTVDEMIGFIKNGEIDIYFDSIYPAYLISEATGAQPILRQWRNCDAEYYSVIVARADSNIASVQDLSGHMIVMDNPYSTSGFVLPSAHLMDQGLTLAVKKTFDEPVAANEVGIYFSFADSNSLALMLDGKIDVAATDDYSYGKWETKTPGQFILLAQTVSMPRRVVLVRSDLANDLKQAIKEELIQAELSAQGRTAMKSITDTCKFDDTPEGIEAAFTQMQQWAKLIVGIPGLQAASQP